MESVSINSYTNFSKQGVFRQGYFLGDLNIRFSPTRQLSFGIGTRFENLHYTSQIPSQLEIHGGIGFFNSYLFFQTNSLSNAVYPRTGGKTNIEMGYVSGQDQHLND